MTQEQVADALSALVGAKVTREYVSRIETGEVDASATRLIELAEAMGTSAARFFDGSL